MSIVKYNPFRPFGHRGTDSWLDDFFGRSLSDLGGSEFTSQLPSVNVLENEDSFEIEVAAPGLRKEDFRVELDNDSLIITAEREDEKKEEKEGKFTRREFNYTSFTRSFQITDAIDTSKIDANYKDGILKLRLGKKETAIRKAPKNIEIQ